MTERSSAHLNRSMQRMITADFCASPRSGYKTFDQEMAVVTRDWASVWICLRSDWIKLESLWCMEMFLSLLI